MQRLFTMFPAGAPGYGLLVLRLCAAGMLLHHWLSGVPVAVLSFEFVSRTIVALFLCLGLFTPLGCVASGLIQVAFQSDRPGSPLWLAFSLPVTAALLLIGPGAYSVDSRLFGRRLIIRSK